jgi:ATP-dependent helicase/nuclease subunit A
MKFTKEQYATLINDRNQIVIANAGSGKTTILVEKYLELIRQVPASDLQKIVAITFTKKAASEMKDRVIRRLNEDIDQLKGLNLSRNEYFSKYQILMEYREHISGAKIQTIHSFCQDILKEFAVEAGFSPNFSLIDDILLEEIKDKFFKETLEEFLVDESFSVYKANDFFDSISKSNLYSMVDYLFRNISVTKYFEKKIENVAFEDYQISLMSNLIKQIELFHHQAVSELWNVKITILTENKKGTCKFIYDDLDKGFTEINLENYQSVIEEYKYFWKKVNEVKVSGNKKVKGFLANPDKMESIMGLLNLVDALIYLPKFFELNKFIWFFYKRFFDKLEDYKVENSFITYDDMLNKTYRLLQNKEIADKVAGNFQYFLIDEFQDTDDIQYSIITKLVPSLIDIVSNSEMNTTKLFIVGDPKQSIYGFRKADVRVMKKAEKDIMKSNSFLFENNKISENVKVDLRTGESHLLNLSKEENLGKIELKISHRLNLINTGFVNNLFGKLMEFDNFEYSVLYNPFIFARENLYLDEIMEDEEIIYETNGISKYGSVNFLSKMDESNL